MTDARFPERWLNDRRILRLSDAAFRLFVTANSWSVSNRTDGELCADDLPLLAGVDTGRADELAKAGLWDRVADRWLIVDFSRDQTTRAQLEGLDRKRLLDRERQARHRAGQSGSKRDSAHEVTRHVTRDTEEGQEGQARKEGAVTGLDYDHDCDTCSAVPVLTDGAGARYCKDCAPHLFRSELT